MTTAPIQCTCIQFLRAASYSVGAHSALVHETNYTTRTTTITTRVMQEKRWYRGTDSGWSTAERRLRGVLSSTHRVTHDLLWSGVVTSASVLAAWSKLNNSNSDACCVTWISRWCCVCSNCPTRWLTFWLSVHLSVCNVHELWSHSAINNYFQ